MTSNHAAKIMAFVCIAAFLLILNTGSHPSAPAVDVFAQNTESAETENSESTVPAETVVDTSQLAVAQPNVFAPNAVTVIQPGIQRLDYTNFQNFCKQGYCIDAKGGILFAYLFQQNTVMADNIVSYYQYDPSDHSIAQISCQRYTDTFSYHGNTVSLDFSYFIRNGQLILFNNSGSGDNQQGISVEPIPNRADIVLVSFRISNQSSAEVLYNLQDHSVAYDFQGTVPYPTSPDGSKIRLTSGKADFKNNSLTAVKEKNVYLDLNDRKIYTMGFDDTYVNNAYGSQIGFINWIDKENVLYYDHLNLGTNGTNRKDTCDVIVKNLSTGKLTAVIKGIEPNYGRLYDKMQSYRQHILISRDDTVWYYNAMTGEKHKISELNGEYHVQMEASPDDRAIAFVSEKEIKNHCVYQFGILNLQTYQATILKENTDTLDYSFHWICNNTVYVDESSSADVNFYQIG